MKYFEQDYLPITALLLLAFFFGSLLTRCTTDARWEDRVQEEKIITIDDRYYKTTEVNLKVVYSEVKK